MATQTQVKTGHIQEKIQELRELFADAPELGKKALDNPLRDLTSHVSSEPPQAVESAGRAGIRLGKVSELTIIVPFALRAALGRPTHRQPIQRSNRYLRPIASFPGSRYEWFSSGSSGAVVEHDH